MVLSSYFEHYKSSLVHAVTAETVPVAADLWPSQSAWALGPSVGSMWTTATIAIYYYYYYSARKLILLILLSRGG